MFSINGKVILGAEASPTDARRLNRILQGISSSFHVADSPERTLQLLRTRVFDQAVVAAELTINGETLLQLLSHLPSPEHLIAIGPPGDAYLENAARRAGARAYLTRPLIADKIHQALRPSHPDEPRAPP